jgi:hypothetical protein
VHVRNVAFFIADGRELGLGALLVEQVDAHGIGGYGVGAHEDAGVGTGGFEFDGRAAAVYRP